MAKCLEASHGPRDVAEQLEKYNSFTLDKK